MNDNCCVVILGTLNHVSQGIEASPYGVVTTAHMSVSCAPPGPMVSKVEKLSELRYMTSMPATETYVNLYWFEVLVYGRAMICAA